MKQMKVPSGRHSEAYGKILQYFFSFPQAETTLNQLALRVKISKTSAQQAIRQLGEEKFLKKKIVGRSWLLSCNPQHWHNYSKKITYFLGEILASDLLPQLNQNYPSSRAIILFGSYRKGDSTEHSDIDIAIEVLSLAKPKIIEFGFFPELGYRKNVPITVHLFSRKDMNLNLFANIANGFVLDGFLEVRP